MRLKSFFSLLLLPCFSTIKAADNKPCTVHSEGKYYDLNPLTSSKDYELKTPEGHDCVLNVCKSVSHETWNLKVPNPENVAGFIRRDRGDFSIGATNSTLVMMGSDPLILLSDGSQCKNSELKASSAIRFICDTSVFGAGTPRLLAQLPPESDELACAFFIEWRTHYACPASLPGDTMGVFAGLVVAIVLFLMLYLVIGTLYNRYVLDRRGFDQIPQPTLDSCRVHITTMCKYAARSFCRSNSYMSTNEASINPHSHQWGVDGRVRMPPRRAGTRHFGREEEEPMIREGEQDPRFSSVPEEEPNDIDIAEDFGDRGGSDTQPGLVVRPL